MSERRTVVGPFSLILNRQTYGRGTIMFVFVADFLIESLLAVGIAAYWS